VKLICTWPVAVSEGVPKFWLAPLFGHSMAAPPEAAASFATTSGENRLCPDRLSSSTVNEVPPVPPLDEDELLELEELEDDELLDEEELLEEELELEELELDELLLDELELEELLLDDELEPLPVAA
jgi:hypothetical protein